MLLSERMTSGCSALKPCARIQAATQRACCCSGVVDLSQILPSARLLATISGLANRVPARSRRPAAGMVIDFLGALSCPRWAWGWRLLYARKRPLGNVSAAEAAQCGCGCALQSKRLRKL